MGQLSGSFFVFNSVFNSGDNYESMNYSANNAVDR